MKTCKTILYEIELWNKCLLLDYGLGAHFVIFRKYARYNDVSVGNDFELHKYNLIRHDEDQPTSRSTFFAQRQIR